MIRKLSILWFIAAVPIILAACDSSSDTGSSSALLAEEKREKKEIAATEYRIYGIEIGLKNYSTKHNGVFPPMAEPNTLRSLSLKTTDEDGKPDGPWIEKYVDAWGNQFHYDWNSGTRENSKDPNMVTPAIWSNGPNGKNENGAGDDIANWRKTKNI